MFKRHLAASVAAALAFAVTPSVAQAQVSDTPMDWAPTFNGKVNAFDRLGGTLFVGGAFTSVTDSKGVTHTRKGAAAIDLSSGKVLRWNPSVRGEVKDIDAARDGVYLAGSFSRVKSTTRRNLARVSTSGKGAVHRRFNVRTNGAVNSVSLSRSTVYFGGEFTMVRKSIRQRVAAVSRKGSAKLTRWSPRATNGVVHEVVRKGSRIFLAGEFRELNRSSDYQRLALVDGKRGATVRSFKPAVDYMVFDIAVTKTRVYAAMGGPAGGEAFAVNALNGAKAWGQRFDGDAQAVAVIGDELFVGGHFTEQCADANQTASGTCLGASTPRQRGASFRLADGTLTDWNPRANGLLGIEELQRINGGRLAAGGDFTAPRARFAVFAQES